MALRSGGPPLAIAMEDDGTPSPTLARPTHPLMLTPCLPPQSQMPMGYPPGLVTVEKSMIRYDASASPSGGRASGDPPPGGDSDALRLLEFQAQSEIETGQLIAMNAREMSEQVASCAKTEVANAVIRM